MKAYACIALVLIVASSVCAPCQTATLRTSTPLHSLPSQSSRVKATLPANAAVSLLGHSKRSGFYHVRTEQGVIGWVSGSALNVEASSASVMAHHAPHMGLSARKTPFSAESSADDRAHSLVPEASQVRTNQCDAGIADFKDCHNSYAEGCTLSSKANTYDAYLNYLKNLMPSPPNAKAELVSSFKALNDFADKENELQQLGIGKQRQADFSQDLADLGQGNIYAYAGYLYYAIPGGIETCNCKLTNPEDSDYHIGIGFDPDMAGEIANGTITVKQSDKEADPIKKASVIVEMTPHYRAKYHSNWTLSRLQQLSGKQVKVVGQLLVDNEHNAKGQNCSLDPQNSQTDLCWRASVWELHPVTNFYICTASDTCQPDSDEGWVELDDLAEN
jgi:uncharacterized protein YgiM (DUF1202 family)